MQRLCRIELTQGSFRWYGHLSVKGSGMWESGPSWTGSAQPGSALAQGLWYAYEYAAGIDRVTLEGKPLRQPHLSRLLRAWWRTLPLREQQHYGVLLLWTDIAYRGDYESPIAPTPPSETPRPRWILLPPSARLAGEPEPAAGDPGRALPA